MNTEPSPEHGNSPPERPVVVRFVVEIHEAARDIPVTRLPLDGHHPRAGRPDDALEFETPATRESPPGDRSGAPAPGSLGVPAPDTPLLEGALDRNRLTEFLRQHDARAGAVEFVADAGEAEVIEILLVVYV